MTLRIRDGSMHELRGFGQLPLVLRPRTTRNPDGHGDTISPARPTTIGWLAIAVLSDGPIIFMRNHKHEWYDCQARQLLPDEFAACKAIVPSRVVTARVFALQKDFGNRDILPSFLLVDERLGKPILGIHNKIFVRHERRVLPHDDRRASRIGGVSIVLESACEWHPDGYDPLWLASVV